MTKLHSSRHSPVYYTKVEQVAEKVKEVGKMTCTVSSL
jgi:hypothetical protein